MGVFIISCTALFITGLFHCVKENTFHEICEWISNFISLSIIDVNYLTMLGLPLIHGHKSDWVDTCYAIFYVRIGIINEGVN